MDNASHAFRVTEPDDAHSPFTGMTRRHWCDAAAYLLEGVLGHVESVDAPLTWPALEATPAERKSPNVLEAVARTFLVAAPLIGTEPERRVAGLPLRDYFLRQVMDLVDPDAPRYVGTLEEHLRQTGRATGAHTVEGPALCIGFWLAGDALWPQLGKAERDRFARWLSSAAHGWTRPHNWRWFNVLMLSFLEQHGYPADRHAMIDHLQHLLAWDTGDGWYRDGGQFDFYNAWAFQYYGAVWRRFHGNAHLPEYAEPIAERFRTFMQTYPKMFARDGRMLLWGRSALYRFGAVGPLAAGFLNGDEPGIDGGWARRIASGCLMQFLGRDDLLEDGVMSLGFHRTFDPIVQGYSHPGSPYWAGKAFTALALPDESPFWSRPESEGDWPTLGQRQETIHLPGPGLAITRFGATGETALRTGKVEANQNNPLYTRLSYHTAFPAEVDDPEGHAAMAYAVRPAGGDAPFHANTRIRHVGQRDGVLYRQTELGGEGANMSRIDLADVPVDHGVIRVDRLRLNHAHDLRLGHYGLPHPDDALPEVTLAEPNGWPAVTAQARDGRRLSLIAIHGWSLIDAAQHIGCNPETRTSTLIFAERQCPTHDPGMALVITGLLHETGNAPDASRVSPLARFDMHPFGRSGSPLAATLHLTDGRTVAIDYGPIEGDLRC